MVLSRTDRALLALLLPVAVLLAGWLFLHKPLSAERAALLEEDRRLPRAERHADLLASLQTAQLAAEADLARVKADPLPVATALAPAPAERLRGIFELLEGAGVRVLRSERDETPAPGAKILATAGLCETPESWTLVAQAPYPTLVAALRRLADLATPAIPASLSFAADPDTGAVRWTLRLWL